MNWGGAGGAHMNRSGVGIGSFSNGIYEAIKNVIYVISFSLFFHRGTVSRA